MPQRLRQPTMYLLAGPNGAGKSTLYADRVKPMTQVPFVNADEIARDWGLRGIAGDAYAAARAAAAQRSRLIEAQQSFVTETVFSHPSKLELIEAALNVGYRVVLYHVNVRIPEMSIARVNARAFMGGHVVPEHKVVERYQRNQPLIRRAAALASTALVFDNSKRGQPPRWLLTLRDGELVAQCGQDIPDWAVRLYLQPR